MDKLKRTHFLDALSGHIFMSQYDAWQKLRKKTDLNELEAQKVTPLAKQA